MDRGAWQATVHGVARVRHDLVTEKQQPLYASCCTVLLYFSRTLLLLLLSRFSHVQLCVTPETAAHQAPPTPLILQARTLE